MSFSGRDGNSQVALDYRRQGRKLELVSTRLFGIVNKGVVSSTSAAEGLYAFSFALSDMADYTNYTSIWDQYKITEIDLSLVPLTLQSAPSAGPGYAIAYASPDYDDATTPANTSALLSYASATYIGPSEKFSCKLAPCVDIATTTSAAATITGSMNVRSPWLDCSTPTVTHYGFKVAITQSTSTNLTQWMVLCRYVVEMRRQQ